MKPRLKLILQNDEKEWLVLFVAKPKPNDDNAAKMSKKVYTRLEVEFSSKKRERCCRMDLYDADSNSGFWEELEGRLVECVRVTLDRRVQFYEEEVRKMSDLRRTSAWSFCSFFVLKESLAFMFQMAHLHEDALREYDELELCYLDNAASIMMPTRGKDFGGLDHGDDQAALLKLEGKPLTQIVVDDSFREFDFRQYLFACQANLLFKLRRPIEVASRGYSFVISFSKTLALHENSLPFCLREVWIITACLALIKATTASDLGGEFSSPDVEKEFYRLQGDLYSLTRVKFMRLAYLVGYGSEIEKSPINSAALSMLPWPKPGVWPSVPPDASPNVVAKEKLMLQANPRDKHFNIQRKPLPLEPSLLLREANRRRASLSAGNVSELFDGRQSPVDGSGLDGVAKVPSNKVHSGMMSRINSGPGNLETSVLSLDRPMKVAEIHVAAENALQRTISDHDLLKSLLTVEEFEKRYLQLTKGAADNYHRSWWRRHGVALDGELAAVCFKCGNFDLAAKSYEKVCALYAGEGWQDLLADVLPNLAECQKILDDAAGYLSSCVRLLSLDKSLFLTKERQFFQSEVVRIAHSEMENPVPLDVSSLIMFSGIPGPPLDLCDGDPGTLSVRLWSGFPDDIDLESLSLTLTPAYSDEADGEGGKARSSLALKIKPGWNTITLDMQPQGPGLYVLGVLTGQIGHLRFRSHSSSKGGPLESDDFMSLEKPTRPVLKVFKPRPLVDIVAASSSALLMNEIQWLGFIIRPINYSLKGAILTIDPGPGLMIEVSTMIEVERHNTQNVEHALKEDYSFVENEQSQLAMSNGKLELPDWASNVTSVVWLPVRALDNGLSKGTTSVHPEKQSIVDGMRTIALKLEFGSFHNQTFEATIAVHFTQPFHVSAHTVDRCGGSLLVHVTLHSLVKATLMVYDATLDLQSNVNHETGYIGPMSNIFPLTISSSSKGAVLFMIERQVLIEGDNSDEAMLDILLNIKYGIAGDRILGAHMPVTADVHSESTLSSSTRYLFYKSALLLQRPRLEPYLGIGLHPLPSEGLKVGQLITMQWKVERLKKCDENLPLASKLDEVLYEVKANPGNWMLAGRNCGHLSLSQKQGSSIVVSIMCLPLVAGYVRPPQLCLPDVGDENIICNPAAPHLVCVLPPTLSSSFCIAV